MKVLMLNYEFPPLGGGSGVANQHLLKELSKQKNLKLDLVTSSTDKYREERFSRNIKIYYLNIGKENKNLHHQSNLDLINYFIKSTAFMLKYKHKYNLIQAFSGLPGGVTAWLSGRPYIVSLRGSDVPGYEERFSWLSQLLKPLIKLSWNKARSVDVNSQHLKKLALKTTPNLKIKVIPNGVDSKRFYPAKKAVDKPVIVCSSRLGERKGINDLIKAMKQVLKKVSEAKLILAGGGVKRKELKLLIERLDLTNKVIFKGRLKHGQLAKIYQQSAVFVLPSLSESMSNSLLEALASGLPVVATKVGGNRELIGSDNGLLVPPADSQALAKAIIKLLANSDLREKMGKANRQMIKEYSWQRSAKKYLELYSKALRN